MGSVVLAKAFAYVTEPWGNYNSKMTCSHEWLKGTGRIGERVEDLHGDGGVLDLNKQKGVAAYKE